MQVRGTKNADHEVDEVDDDCGGTGHGEFKAVCMEDEPTIVSSCCEEELAWQFESPKTISSSK